MTADWPRTETDDYIAIARFLEDPAVAAAFEGLKETYYEEFLAASYEEERTEAWAKARALVDIRATLQGMADRLTLQEHRK